MSTVWLTITEKNTGKGKLKLRATAVSDARITSLEILPNIIMFCFMSNEYFHSFVIMYFSTLEFAQMGLFLSKKLGPYQRKWTLGVPFYGRHITTGEAKAFYELAPLLKDNRTDLVNDFFYNSQVTIYQKILMAKIAGVGGIMIWELGQDIHQYLTHSDGINTFTEMSDNSLMAAVYRAKVSKEHLEFMDVDESEL